MNNRDLINFMTMIEKLKCQTRHSWTSSGRQESVAEHSWRVAVMALIVAENFPRIDLTKLLKMCLLHDLGEAVTGDIPVFEKTEQNQVTEKEAIKFILSSLPDKMARDFQDLFDEMEEMTTEEAQLMKALDKLEVLLSHNEAPIETWIPKEYSLNLVHGDQYVEYSDYLSGLREEIRQDTIQKLKSANKI
ncbi:HD domain-containing protein [Facklamia lactis]|uniref:HD domain-containing protein n=1 Tax=Facklamia lactis TaxID=2749967 RepID=UPI0018CE2ED5|nr:HD domain-containing protein [Facklamia lactis]MBG9980349.1 HD domain-containing protein [Facklamia lactis]